MQKDLIIENTLLLDTVQQVTWDQHIIRTSALPRALLPILVCPLTILKLEITVQENKILSRKISTFLCLNLLCQTAGHRVF